MKNIKPSQAFWLGLFLLAYCAVSYKYIHHMFVRDHPGYVCTATPWGGNTNRVMYDRYVNKVTSGQKVYSHDPVRRGYHDTVNNLYYRFDRRTMQEEVSPACQSTPLYLVWIISFSILLLFGLSIGIPIFNNYLDSLQKE
jgi:hypothetical protein